jgi:phosphomannomutase
MTKTLSIDEVMARSGVAFGTSGARGLVSAMTDEVCFAYTAAFLQHLAGLGQFAAGRPVAIAGDLRPSTPRIMEACTAAIRHMGGRVVNCGHVPSPAVAAYGFAHNIPSLMVTGSHIPADRNGIKFNRTDGEVLKSDEQGIRGQTVLLPEIFDGEGGLRLFERPGDVTDVVTPYVARYVDAFGPQALQGMRLGVYEHSAVGRDILTSLVRALGGEAVPLGRSEQFIPVDTEAVRPEDQKLAREWAQTLKLDAILSSDGDSDRPLLADESGAWLRGDILGILCAAGLGIEGVSTPVSCNSAVELSGLFKTVRRTRIGSPYVIESMNDLLAEGYRTVCGYEANGGFLLAAPAEIDGRKVAALPTRDAVLPMITVLAEARRKDVKLSTMVAELPSRFTYSDRLQNYATARSQALLTRLQQGDLNLMLARLTKMFGSLAGAAVMVNTTDGLRVTFDTGEVIHLRPSGNAPELRCYTESASMQRAERLAGEVLSLVADTDCID